MAMAMSSVVSSSSALFKVTGTTTTVSSLPNSIAKDGRVRVARRGVNTIRASAVSVDADGDKGVEKRRAVVMGAVVAFGVSLMSNLSAKAEEQKKDGEEEERKVPKNGSPEAIAEYYRVCRTMPTAKICHN